MILPMSCPNCRACSEWRLVATDTYKSGVSGKKAILGGILFGGVGAVLGGLSGKKKKAYTFSCSKCGFSHTYTE